MITVFFEVLLFAISSFVVGLSGALVPGPMLTVTISDSLEKGAIAGPMIVLGHLIAEIALIIIFILGLRLIIGSSISTILIGTVGGMVLIYMGYKISKSSPPNLHGPKIENNKYGSVISGMVSSISNPYFFIWWVTIGWAFMLQGMELAGIAGIIGFIVGHWGADFGYYSIVSVLTSKGSEFINTNHYKMLMKICGVFLVILGVYFVLNAQIGVL